MERLSSVVEGCKLLREKVDEKKAGELRLDLLEKVVQRLNSFSQCQECQEYLCSLDETLDSLSNGLEKQVVEGYQRLINEIVSHLQDEHKLIEEGHHMSLYMSLGMSVGLVFGLVVFDNLALGLSFGISIGAGIGLSIDAAAKKKGDII